MALLLIFALCIELAFGGMSANQPQMSLADIDMAVEAHNKCRRETDADPPLTLLAWDENLAAFAMKHSKEIAQAKCGTGPITTDDHSYASERQSIPGYEGKTAGENGGLVGARDRTVGEIFKVTTDMFCNEKHDYTIQTDTSTGVTGHYKQVASQHTRKFGCGYAICNNEYAYVFCNYQAMYDGGRPYLHGASIDCSKIEDATSTEYCQGLKDHGFCDGISGYTKCIKTCATCSKPANAGIGGSGSSPATTVKPAAGTTLKPAAGTTLKPAAGTTVKPAATTARPAQTTTTGNSGGYNTNLCTPDERTETDSTGGKKVIKVTCYGEDWYGYSLTCTETKTTFFDANGGKTSQNWSTSCGM